MAEKKRKFPVVVKNGAKTELLEMSEISLWLDDYNDIFSDFDPRAYNEKALSDDFLAELKRASKDKPSGAIELSFLVARKKRDRKSEPTIKKRLKEHFNKHHDDINDEKNRVIRNGLLFTLSGITLMVFATFILIKEQDINFAISFLLMLSEPGGWFLFWEGLNLMIFEWKKKKPDLDFYRKLSKSRISFYDY